MKDLYKILGVKENASEEEIRERWIELTKHYHPDRGVDIASEEKIREINEAYQVLKHSSTRVEYDLNRTYGPQKREGKRSSQPGKFALWLAGPTGIEPAAYGLRVRRSSLTELRAHESFLEKVHQKGFYLFR